MSVHSDINKQIQKLQKVCDETNRLYVEAITDAALMICSQAVDDFYEDYTPVSYDRLGTLHKIYDVQIRDGVPFLTLNDSKLDGHRVSNEYIYMTSFQEGWHGGREMDGAMRYPTGRLAEFTSPSPLEQIQNNIESLDVQRIFWTGFASAVKKYYF